MKKIAALAAATMIMAAGVAQAEHKLLVTDLLEPGQIEAQAQYEYLYKRGKIEEAGETGKLKKNSSESRYSLGAGIGLGAEVSLSVPYLLSEREREDLAGETLFDKKDGFGDITFGIKKSIADFQGLKVVAGVDVKFDTARETDGGTGTTDVAPYLAISKSMGNHLIPYAGYRAILRNHDASDSHVITVGAEKELNHTVTLDLKADASFNTSSDRDGGSNQAYTFELASYIQVAKNLYLLPSVAWLATTGYDQGELKNKTATGIRPGLSLYYLF